MATNIPVSKVAVSRSDSHDPRNDVVVQQDHFIGIDVGTGSARACIINEKGDIVGLASKNIGLWQPQTGYYVRLALEEAIASVANRCDRNNLLLTSGDVSAIASSKLLLKITSM